MTGASMTGASGSRTGWHGAGRTGTSVPMSVVPQPRHSGPRLLLLAALAVLALLVAGTAVVVAWYRDAHPAPVPPAPPGYQVSVFLTADATGPDKRAIEAALPDLRPVGGIQFETRQEAWQRFKEQFKDSPDLVNSTRPESLPESYRLTVPDLPAVCPALHRIRQLPGVDEVVTTDLALRTPSFAPGPQPHAANC